MKQDALKEKENGGASAPQDNSVHPAVEALVRCLARIAAEKDYEAYGGPRPPGSQAEGEG